MKLLHASDFARASTRPYAVRAVAGRLQLAQAFENEAAG
jgi:hypothetical protein